jgi:hypothetical protein
VNEMRINFDKVYTKTRVPLKSLFASHDELETSCLSPGHLTHNSASGQPASTKLVMTDLPRTDVHSGYFVTVSVTKNVLLPIVLELPNRFFFDEIFLLKS